MHEMLGLVLELSKKNFLLGFEEVTTYKKHPNIKKIGTYSQHRMEDYIDLFKVLNNLYFYETGKRDLVTSNVYTLPKIESLSKFIKDREIDVEKLKKIKFFKKVKYIMMPCSIGEDTLLKFHKVKSHDYHLMMEYYTDVLFKEAQIPQQNFLADRLDSVENIMNLLLLDI